MLLKRLLLFLVFFVSFAYADYVVKYKVGQETVSFYFKNANTSKMVTTTDDGKVEIYHINNNSYIVSYFGDDVNIIDANMMKSSMSQMGFDTSSINQKPQTSNIKIKKTRKKIWIGDVEGRKWIVTVNEDGRKYNTTVVVSNDKRVVRVMRAMFKAFSSMTQGASDYDKYYELKKGFVTIKADGIELESFRKKFIPMSEYQLPNVDETKKHSGYKKRRYKNSNKTVNYLSDSDTTDDSDEILDTDTTDNSSELDLTQDTQDDSDDLDKATNLLKSFF